MRNILFFCFLPMIRNVLPFDLVAHLGLYITAIRVSMMQCLANYLE